VLLRRMLRQFGIEEERVQLVWASASEGTVLAAAVNRMTEQLRALGPLRWKWTVLGGNPLDGLRSVDCPQTSSADVAGPKSEIRNPQFSTAVPEEV